MESVTTKVYTHNIDNDRRVEQGYTASCAGPQTRAYAAKDFDGFRFTHRIDRLMDEIREENADLVGLCEITIDNKKLMSERLKGEGYEIVCDNSHPQAYAPYQVPDLAFYYLVCHKPTLKLLDSRMVWSTSTPLIPLTQETRPSDPLLLSLKEQFEKSSLVCLFQRQDGVKFIYVINHLVLRSDYQVMSMEILNREIEKLIVEWDTDSVIVAGDFNTFPLNSEALATMTQQSVEHQHSDYSWDMRALNKLQGYKLREDKTVPFSFASRPYDIGLTTNENKEHMTNVLLKIEDSSEKRVAFGNFIIKIHGHPLVSTLDHVLVKGVDVKKYKVKCPFTSMEELTEAFLRSCETGVPITPSDHMATVLEF